MKRYNKLISTNILLVILIVSITSVIGNPMPIEMPLDFYSQAIEIEPSEMVLFDPNEFVNLTILNEIHNDQNPTLNIRIRWLDLDYYNFSTYNNKTEISFRDENAILYRDLDIFLTKRNDSYYSYSFVYDCLDERGCGEIYHGFGFIPFNTLNTTFLIENKGNDVSSQLRINYMIFVSDYNGLIIDGPMNWNWWFNTWGGLFTILGLSISSSIFLYLIIKKIVGRITKC